jgi:hypothetical protein
MKHNSLNRLSITLNLVLMVVCVALALRLTSTANRSEPQNPIGPGTNHNSNDARRIASHPEKVALAVPRNWIDVLRAQGIPERVIIRLVLSDFDDRWQLRQDEAQQAYNRGDVDSDGLAALAREHDLEQENDLRARLGEDAFRRWDQERLFQQFHLGDITLTTAETNSLYDLAANLRQRMRELDRAKQANEIDQATLSSGQKEAQKDFEKQLRALLGDERYGAIHGTDPSVGELRRNLRGLPLDDRQFATLLHAQQQWDSERSDLEQQQVETRDPKIAEQLRALNEDRDRVFEGILGTNGFALFQKQQDSRYLEMQKNAARWGIDSSTIDQIYGLIQSYDKIAGDYVRKARETDVEGAVVDWDLLNRELQNYSHQISQNLRTNIGDALFDVLDRNQLLPFQAQ